MENSATRAIFGTRHRTKTNKITQRQKTEGAIKNRAIEQHSAQDTERRQSAQKHNAAHKPKIMTRIPPNNRGCLLRVNSSCFLLCYGFLLTLWYLQTLLIKHQPCYS